MKKLYIYSVLLVSAFLSTINTYAQEKGSEENPYTIAQIQALATDEFPSEKVWVAGYVVGAMDNQGAGAMKLIEWQAPINRQVVQVYTNIILADEPFVTIDHTPTQEDLAKIIPIQLPDNSVRATLNLRDHPEVMSGYILVYGNVDTYFTVNGIRNTTETNIDHLPTGINESFESDHSITTDGSKIKVNASKTSTFSIYLVDGKLIKSGTIDLGENTLELSKGVYILSLNNKSTKVIL